MSEIATIPSPTITIFCRWTWLVALGLPSTGSPYRNPSSTGIGMTETEQCEIEYNTMATDHGTHSSFKKNKCLILLLILRL